MHGATIKKIDIFFFVISVTKYQYKQPIIPEKGRPQLNSGGSLEYHEQLLTYVLHGAESFLRS